MEIIIGLLMLYGLFYLFAGVFLPLLCKALVVLMKIVAAGLEEAFRRLAPLALQGLIWLSHQLWRGLKLAWFVGCEVFKEAIEAPPEDEPLTGPGAALDAYEAARQILGLPPEFTQAEFKLAYRRAMRNAHPDKGGSDRHAMLVNRARDLIRARKGW